MRSCRGASKDDGQKFLVRPVERANQNDRPAFDFAQGAQIGFTVGKMADLELAHLESCRTGDAFCRRLIAGKRKHNRLQCAPMVMTSGALFAV
jgi:hypothetical protein